jgi:hypothetical protein
MAGGIDDLCDLVNPASTRYFHAEVGIFYDLVYPVPMYRRALLLWLALLSTTAAAGPQISQGWIEGRVSDAAGSQGLAGVQVTLISRGGKTILSASTDAAGGYHFLTIPPGDYDLDFRKAGYAAYTVRAVQIASGRAGIVDLRMDRMSSSVSIPWQGRPADLWASDYGSSFDAEWLTLLPSARNIWALLENQERSTVTNAPQEGGFTTGVIALAGALGASWTQNSYRFDGVNVSDPFETGKPLVYPDYSSLQELRASNALHSAQVAAPGVSITMTSRENGRSFHFAAEGYYLGEPFQSTNLDEQLRGFGFTTDPHFKRFGEGQFLLGGALPGTKRWSFLSSLGIQHLTRVIPDFTAVPQTTVSSALLRLDGRPGLRDQVSFVFTGQILNNSNLGARSDVAPMTTLRGYDRFEVVQGHWTRYQSSDLVWQVLGGFSHSSPTDTFQHGISEPNRTQLFTGEMAGAAPLESDSARSRFSLAGQGQVWPRYFPGRHQLEFGFDLEESKSTEERRVFGDYRQLYYPRDVPVEVIQYNTPSHTKQRLRELSFYLEDRLRISGRLCVRAGVSLDASNAFLPPQESGTGTYVPVRKFAGAGSVVSWTTLSPRVGVSMPLQIRRLGEARLSAGYARYYHLLPASYANYANPTSLGGGVFLWNDPNHDGAFQGGEEGTLLRVFGGPYSSVDPGLRRPFTDEFAVGLDQRVGDRFSIEVRGFQRDQKRLIETVNVGVSPTAYTPASVVDTGDDNIPGTADDQMLTVFNQDPRTLGQDRYLLTNPPGQQSSYKGLEIAVRGDLGGHGFLSLSFTAYKSAGSTNPGNTEFENDPGIVGSLFDDPNTRLNAQGRIFFDRAYVGKMASYVRLPFGLHSGSAIRYADGLPFGRKLIITGFHQGPFYVMATPRGQPGGFRTQYNLSFDQRVARDFAFSRFRLSVMVDVFNLLNRNNNLREHDISGPLFPPRTAVETLNPRVLRLGLRLSL